MTLELSDRDYAHHLLGDTINLDAQLLAIHALLRRNQAADDRLSAEIREIAEDSKTARGSASWRLDDLWVEHLENSVYQDAAHSMAAVGMLAPLLESVFARLFAAIGERVEWPPASSVRRTRTGEKAARFWNPQIYFAKDGTPKDDLPLGIRQLAQETGLAAELPADYVAVVKALFAYRNQMFHNGLEWPLPKRESFDRLIMQEGWPADWFTRATSDQATWIIYMGEPFVRRCLDFTGELLDAAGGFARGRFETYGYPIAGELTGGDYPGVAPEDTD